MNSLNSHKVGEVLVVDLEGRLDATCSEAVEKSLRELIEQGNHKLAIGLHRVEHMDSSGLGVLLAAVKRARPEGGDVRIFGIGAALEPVFRITGMHRVFRIFDDQTSAVQSFQLERLP